MEKQTLRFRLLKANEIDCRISTVTENGLSLLLYKDARVDQNILDEAVGPLDWQKEYKRDNANCVVSIWDREKGQWIGKEDTGTESYTEKEKGLASDSFKRACFCWGIGRELYTAPFIWISSKNCKIYDTNRKNNGKAVFSSNDKFHVSKIGYDDERNINMLVIKNKANRVVYTMADTQERESQICEEAACNETEISGLTDAQCNTIKKCLKDRHMTQKEIMNRFKVKDIRNMTIEQFQEFMDEVNPPAATESDMKQATPPNDNCGLPFN